jgi:hypothetical protein
MVLMDSTLESPNTKCEHTLDITTINDASRNGQSKVALTQVPSSPTPSPYCVRAISGY